MKRLIILFPILISLILRIDSHAELPHQFLFGHTHRVLAIAFSSDGQWLASGGDREYEIYIWDVETGEHIHTLTGHTAQIKDLAFRINGNLASASEDGGLRLWDVPAQEEIRQFNEHQDGLTSVAFSPDGKRLVAGSIDQTLRLWEVDTGRLITTYEGHEGIIWSVAFSPDGETIASASEDRTVRLWNVSDGSGNLIDRTSIKTFTGHTNRVWSVTFHPNKNLVASGSWDGTVRVWNVDANTDELALQEPFAMYNREVLSIGFSPDGRLLAVGLRHVENDNPLKLWDVATGRELQSFDTKSRHDLAFSLDRSRLATAGAADGTIIIWNSSHLTPALSEPEDGVLIETSNVTFGWEAVEDSVYYDVEISHNPDFIENTQLTTVTENHLDFEVNGETPNYWWRVRTGSLGQVGEWSQPRSLRIPFDPPLTCDVRILPPRRQVNLGQEFHVEVLIDSAPDLAGFQFDLQWTNPDVLNLVTVTEFRNIFEEFGIGQVGEIDRELGVYRDVVATKPGSSGVSGSGTLLKVLFSGKDIGSSNIQLNNLKLVNSAGEQIHCNTFNSQIEVADPARPWDVNGDGIVDVFDLSAVAKYFGQEITVDVGLNPDINSDGAVDLQDIVLVGNHFGESYPMDGRETAAAPHFHNQNNLYLASHHRTRLLPETYEVLQRIYADLLTNPDNSPPFVRTRQVLRHLLSSVHPSQDVLFQNYPNPFNPETWIPFQLTSAGDVIIKIHDVNGSIVRKLALGHFEAGSYMSRADAAYWDGNDRWGEPVASGVYFYTISTRSFRATRAMTIVK
jgi:WD40 repeat protein